MLRIEKYEGLVAAPFTPLGKDGHLNTPLIPDYYRFLEKNGVTGAFINGSTGEGPSLTQKEKQLNALEWANCLKNGGKVRVINLLGGTSYDECIENAIMSEELGLSAVAMVPPYYFKPDESALVDFVARVGESVPSMPVYFYHIPVLTGVFMPMAGFLKKISSVLPNFAGIKFTHEDFMDFFSCLNYENGKYDILWGRDECMLAALALGTKGFVGSTYNYAAPLYNSLISAFRENDLKLARTLQLKSVNMIRLLSKYGGMATGKAYMKYVGMDCGLFRSPVSNMDENIAGEFVKDVKALGMDNLFSVR